MFSDPIADFLIRMKNGYLASQDSITSPYSKMREQIVNVLKDFSFVGSVEILTDGKKKNLKVGLLYKDKNKKKRALLNIKRISKTGRRFYSKKKNLKPILGGFGIAILSTSKGVMSDFEAKKQNLGGEVICYVW